MSKKFLSVFLSVVLAVAALAMPTSAADRLPESAHNYANNAYETYDYTASAAAAGLLVTFSDKTYVEPAADLIALPEDGQVTVSDVLQGGMDAGDFLAVIDGDGQVVGVYDGDALAGKTLFVGGRSFRVILSSDAATTGYGFAVTSVVPVNARTTFRVTYHSGLDGIHDFYRTYYSGSDNTTADYYPFYYGETVPGDLALIGWATEPDGPIAYDLDASFPEDQEDIDLYAVWMKVALREDEVFSFNNYSGYFVNDERGEKYYMSKKDYRTLQLNSLRVFGPAVIAAPVMAIMLYDILNDEWGGSCYGLATTIALQHLGMVDLLSMQDVETVRDLEPDDELISLINYYHAQQRSSWLTENLAYASMPSMYKTQLKALCDSVRAGNLAIFSFYPESTLTFKDVTGHTVLITGIYDDAEGNHVLIAYDANKPWYYEAGDHGSRFTISKDYSKVTNTYDDVIVDVKWADDFSQFKPFARDGSGAPLSWYLSLLKHIIATFNDIFRAFRTMLSK